MKESISDPGSYNSSYSRWWDVLSANPEVKKITKKEMLRFKAIISHLAPFLAGKNLSAERKAGMRYDFIYKNVKKMNRLFDRDEIISVHDHTVLPQVQEVLAEINQ